MYEDRGNGADPAGDLPTGKINPAGGHFLQGLYIIAVQYLQRAKSYNRRKQDFHWVIWHTYCIWWIKH